MANSITVRTVRRIDPAVIKIIDSAKQVQLYRHEDGNWEKTDFAGALHVCGRAAPPFFTMVIINRLNSKSWIEPITKRLDFQQQLPFLLYRASDSPDEILGLWFYDQEECKRFADLVFGLQNQNEGMIGRREAAARAKAATRDADGQSNDILRLLVDANNEFLAKRRRRRRQEREEVDNEEEDEVDDDENYSDDDVESDIEDALEDEPEDRQDNIVLFKPTPRRPHGVGADPAVVAGSASTGMAGYDGLQTNANPNIFPPVPTHAPQPSLNLHGEENILKKLFSNATFDLGSTAMQSSLPPVNPVPNENVALEALRRMASGGPPLPLPSGDSHDHFQTLLRDGLPMEEFMQEKRGLEDKREARYESGSSSSSEARPPSSVLMTPAMFGLSDDRRGEPPPSSSVAKPKGSSMLLRGGDDHDKRRTSSSSSIPGWMPRQKDFGTLPEFKEALIHVIQNNDVFVREIMEVMREKMAKSSPQHASCQASAQNLNQSYPRSDWDG